ncbi:hypothetical protein EGW08_003087 [Elysia chlorotica]|uniref:Uncharacterized protein n=1 Tax=Elysia chlorotica TaxID=188477 RepID=A0A3S1BUM4_ELYCH|nr:hypothetical protein EGW08_003087 [Elysia chlorotica]
MEGMSDVSIDEIEDFLSLWSCGMNSLPDPAQIGNYTDIDSLSNLKHSDDGKAMVEKQVPFLQDCGLDVIDLVANMETIEQSQWSFFAPELSKSEMQSHPDNEFISISELSNPSSFMTDFFPRNSLGEDGNAFIAVHPFSSSYKNDYNMSANNCVHFDESTSKTLSCFDVVEDSEIPILNRGTNQIKEISHFVPLENANNCLIDDKFKLDVHRSNAFSQSPLFHDCQTTNKSFNQMALDPGVQNICTTINADKTQAEREVISKMKDAKRRLATSSNFEDSKGTPLNEKSHIFDQTITYQTQALPFGTESLKEQSGANNIHNQKFKQSCPPFSKVNALSKSQRKNMNEAHVEAIPVPHNEVQVLNDEHQGIPQPGLIDFEVFSTPLKSSNLELVREEVENNPCPRQILNEVINSKKQTFEETNFKKRIPFPKKPYPGKILNKVNLKNEIKNNACKKNVRGECTSGISSCSLSKKPTTYRVGKKDRLINVPSEKFGQLMVRDLLSLSGNIIVGTEQEKFDDFRSDLMLVNHYKQKRLQQKNISIN